MTCSIVYSLFFLIISNMADDLQEQFSQNNAKFAFDIYSEVKKDNLDKNIIISPFSIQTCVGLAFAGANGKTAEEIATGLHLVSNDTMVVGQSFKNVLDLYKDSPLLKIANKFYIASGYAVKNQFNEIATKYFHSEAENIDFKESNAAAAKMNNWVSEKTNDKIKNLISSDALDSDTRMVLLNAIYFKGSWQYKFKEQDTKKEDFYINESDTVKVDMMKTKHNFRYSNLEDLDAEALEMPYKDSNLSMLILLPKSKSGLENLETKLRGMSLTSITQNMYMTDVIVKMPKFKTEFEIELKDVFEKMNMGTMFGGEADFDNLLESPEPLKVSKIIHKAFIEVNEEGTEAAAATGMIMMMRCAIIEPPPIEFTADRPFLYMIKDNEKHVFFSGRIINN